MSDETHTYRQAWLPERALNNPSLMTVKAGWRSYSPYSSRDEEWRRLTSDERVALMRDPTVQVLRNGVVLLGYERRQAVVRMLGLHREQPTVFDPTLDGDDEVRPLIPGLTSHDGTPALIGPKGWGKTHLLSEWTSALVTPGARFLDYFEPAQMTDEERARDTIWMVPETRPAVIHKGLLNTGLAFGRRDGMPCYYVDNDGRDERGRGLGTPDRGVLIVDHLKKRTGGGRSFDLTDEAKWEVWADHFVAYADHYGPPLNLIVDGVTAMLGSVTSRYGLFSSALPRLLQETGIPNGLAVLHSPMGISVNTPMNGVESMGEWDGMIIASSPHFPVAPSSARYIESYPRWGDPVLPLLHVLRNEEDRLRAETTGPASRSAPTLEPSRREVLRERLRQGSHDLLTTEVCREGDEYRADRAELAAMEAAGEVVSHRHGGKSHGVAWSLARREA